MKYQVFYNKKEYEFEGNNVGNVAHKFFKWAINSGLMKNRPKWEGDGWKGVEIRVNA